MKTKTCGIFKKIAALLLLLALVCSAILVLPAHRRASAESIIDEQNEAIVKDLILKLAEDNGFETDTFSYEPFDVYYPSEEWAGVVVEFDLADTVGYGIFFKMQGIMTMIEISFEYRSPFYGKQGLFLYPALDCYYIKQGNEYYNAKTDELLPDFDPADYVGAGSKIEGNCEEVTKNYNYHFGNFYSFELDNFIPYNNLTDHPNDCANIAGVTMLNYWNQKYSNKILKETRLSAYGDLNGDAAKEYAEIFYNYMKTNRWLFPFLDWGYGGTSNENCCIGFKQLIEEKGYKCKYGDATTFNQNADAFQQNMNRLKNGYPLFITSADYYFVRGELSQTLPQDGRTPRVLTVHHNRYTGLSYAHTFTAYGYGYYDLTDLSTSSINRYEVRFYKVMDGWGSQKYFNINESVIDEIRWIMVTE